MYIFIRGDIMDWFQNVMSAGLYGVFIGVVFGLIVYLFKLVVKGFKKLTTKKD